MLRTLIILGGMLAVSLSAPALAEPTLRPQARSLSAAQEAVDAHARLASFRAVARPDHMIRYAMTRTAPLPKTPPQARGAFHPATRWTHKPGHDLWTRAAMSAVSSHGEGLDSIVPRDIERWCPAYEDNPPELRQAFWVGMMSALAKHESTYNPNAVGGPDLWYGLLQIYPPTARSYGCRARTGEALKNPTENLSCAARIMNVTVARDKAIAIYDGRWRGVAADWGPMSNRRKIPEMAAWTSRQSYCVSLKTIRPQARPAVDLFAQRPVARPPMIATVSTMDVVSSE